MDSRAPDAIGSRFGRPLFAVHGANRYGMLLALRRRETTHSVYLFGESLHYTDERDVQSDELAAYLVRGGFTDARVEPITAGIEDSFIALMGSAA